MSTLTRYLLIALLFAHQALFAASPSSSELLGHKMKRLHSPELVSLEERYAGKPLLFINTASHCGYTPQFKGLEVLYKKYGVQGLMVAGFPSNSFRQEAKDEEGIKGTEGLFSNQSLVINYKTALKQLRSKKNSTRRFSPNLRKLLQVLRPPSFQFT